MVKPRHYDYTEVQNTRSFFAFRRSGRRREPRGRRMAPAVWSERICTMIARDTQMVCCTTLGVGRADCNVFRVYH
eukprot:scaffold106125_cov75-Phaeocystis_antarctica.AAC.1